MSSSSAAIYSATSILGAITREASRRIELVDVELVLALNRDIDPWLRRVEVEMPRPEVHAVTGLDRNEICEHAVFEAEGFDRAWVHRVIGWRVVAARNQDDLLVVRRGADLVRVFAGVQRIPLVDAFA